MASPVFISEPTLAPLRLESVGGAVPLESVFYVPRSTDKVFLEAIARHEGIVLVKGARQMGKTSLLARGLQQARLTGSSIILTDIQKLNARSLKSAETFFFTLADLIAEQLDLAVLPEQVWHKNSTPQANFERYLRTEVLTKLPHYLVWGLDELDRLFAYDYSDDVFALFRSWHNERALNPKGPCSRLTLAISYATEASLFIHDLNQSPFNVGVGVTLEDFTPAQVAELNRLYGSPLRHAEELARFYDLVGGHPFLVRRGLHEVAAHRMSLDELEKQADREDGIYGDHLRRIPLLLGQDPEFQALVRGLLENRICPTESSFNRLRSAGLVVGDSEITVRPRCQLYVKYLKRHLA